MRVRLQQKHKEMPRNLHFQPICPNVSVQPELKPSIIDELQDDLRTLAAVSTTPLADVRHSCRHRDDAEPSTLQGQEGNGHHVRPQRGQAEFLRRSES